LLVTHSSELCLVPLQNNNTLLSAHLFWVRHIGRRPRGEKERDPPFRREGNRG
jgi:hypothetical protein